MSWKSVHVQAYRWSVVLAHCGHVSGVLLVCVTVFRSHNHYAGSTARGFMELLNLSWCVYVCVCVIERERCQPERVSDL